MPKSLRGSRLSGKNARFYCIFINKCFENCFGGGGPIFILTPLPPSPPCVHLPDQHNLNQPTFDNRYFFFNFDIVPFPLYNIKICTTLIFHCVIPPHPLDIVDRCSVVENQEKGGVSWGFGKTLENLGGPLFSWFFFAFL